MVWTHFDIRVQTYEIKNSIMLVEFKKTLF